MVDIRLAADIGGTFTDLALTINDTLWTTKLLTTPSEPARAVLQGISTLCHQSSIGMADIDVFVHGTTLATNALIERRGALTGFLTTHGMRDSIEMAHENRFEQYDLAMRRPEPLVPRNLRVGIRERLDSKGNVLIELNGQDVLDAAEFFRSTGVESIAIGYLHSYHSDAHEQATADLIRENWPEVSITLSSQVCPEIREYERFSTTCANAYIQPLMAEYLTQLDAQRKEQGMLCQMFLMQSGGGLGTLEEALKYPVRLVESGPAGGALLSAEIARELDLKDVLSFDMGGTTAKLCIINNGRPRTSREFEVAREYRFLAGSGIPLRLPVIEMVEIGAGGSSVAHLDQLGRIAVGPRSTGSQPGPASYGAGGHEATVTDADVILGKIVPDFFADGEIPLDIDAATTALNNMIAIPASLTSMTAAIGVAEVVDENMANAGRAHAIEQGCDITGGTLIAFGGAAPLHAARVAQKLAIDTIIVPSGAGVGSAIGFLRAPASHEAVRTRYHKLSTLTMSDALDLLQDMRREAYQVVNSAAPNSTTTENVRIYMRYLGQGHEIPVEVDLTHVSSSSPNADYELREHLTSLFLASYRNLYAREIPGLEIEALNWLLTIQTVEPPLELSPTVQPTNEIAAVRTTPVNDPTTGETENYMLLEREALEPGSFAIGPALVVEAQTTTVVPPHFRCFTVGAGHLQITKMEGSDSI
ncbi:MAG: hydantoinase/oxoprolinase family protein [Acidimicrobiales bacterium]|nr:hydantoinase/oxoprolinase family protein [Acidimicrobiales bacterium]